MFYSPVSSLAWLFYYLISILAAVWSRALPEAKYEPMMMEENEECIGIANIDIDKLAMRQLLVGWYKLFPAK